MGRRQGGAGLQVSLVSANNATFEVCPYPDDQARVFKGVLHRQTVMLKVLWTHNSSTAIEGCRKGTRGPLCSICEPGHNRDADSYA